MHEELIDISDLQLKRPLLTWLSYPGNAGKFCFAYPQWMQTATGFDHISPEALPTRGAFFVSLQDANDSEDIRAKFGEVVVATLNSNPPENRSWAEGTADDRYYTMFNTRYTGSQIEFTRLENHGLGRSLMQVVELEDDLSFDKPLKNPVALHFNTSLLLTRWIMVEKTQGSSLVYYGPFAAQRTAEGTYELDAVADFHNLVFKVDSSQAGDVIAVKRMRDGVSTAARFIDRSVIVKLQKSSKAPAVDWVTDEELVDAIGSVLKKAQAFKMRPEDVKAARDIIKSCTVAEAGLYLNDARRKRMADLLSKPALWRDQIDVLAAALARPEASEELVNLALSKTYFPLLKDLLAENEDIQQIVEQEKQRYYVEADQARRAAAEAVAAKEEAELELVESQKRLASLREEAISSVRQELDDLAAQRDAAHAELEQAQEELKALDSQARAIIENLDSTVEGMTRNLLTSRMVSRMHSLIIDEDSPDVLAPAEEPDVAYVLPAPRSNEDDLSPQDVVGKLHQRLAVRAGRELSETDVVNLLVCLMGSSITVLSGLPGTGKTSLATLLAGALGLAQPDAPRFAKIAVERGWTSHRDYVGYFNPLTKRLEASNASLLEVMRNLDAEFADARTANGVTERSVPYLMLLDEANLSVVENYWSPFLSNADTFLSSPVELNMQGGKPLMIPSNVRWLATVNYDHTTEALSERFLNRAWVISTEAASLSLDDLLGSSDACDFGDVAPFTYRKLMETFGPHEGAHIEDAGAKRLLSAFFAQCDEHGKPVSYRCQRAIARYVATAEPLMRELRTSAGTCAADFALAQRVLPSLNGTGEEMRGLLEHLRETSPLLERTNTRIERMLRTGDADGFYQFFA